MKCPVCGCTENKVLETRSAEDDRVIKRRRECNNCRTRFTTLEAVVGTNPLMVCKRDNTHEPFDRSKILNGVIKACQKRPVSIRQMEALIDCVESEIASTPKLEISTSLIGEKVMDELRKLDSVAYIRFVSVYRKFEDLDSFLLEIDKLKQEEK